MLAIREKGQYVEMLRRGIDGSAAYFIYQK